MSDIQKLAVYDSRIVQSRPKFSVDKGALSLTNSPFRAIAQTAAQLTFNIQVPSLNVFVDREIEMSSGVRMQVDVDLPFAAGIPAANVPYVVFGRDCALPAFPMQSLFTTMTATINDTTSTINCADVLYEVLRMVDLGANRVQRTCPTQLDKYQNYNDGAGAINNVLGTYFDATQNDNVDNGAWGRIQFTDANGAVLNGNAGYLDPRSGQVINTVGGVPCLTAFGGNLNNSVRIFYQYETTEKLVLSPFVFNDMFGNETGLFGINNIQLVCNVGQAGRNLRSAMSAAGAPTRSLSNVALNGTAQSPWVNPRINVQFLTPNLSIDLPPRSVVDYMEYPRYITSTGVALNPGQQTRLQSNTITLPQIPDMLMIYVKPQSYNTLATPGSFGTAVAGAGLTSNEADWYCAINSISINFDNFAGLLSSHTQEQLYGMSYSNGVNMDWQTWSGQARVLQTAPNAPITQVGGAATQQSQPTNNAALVGSLLVLKPSKDITLQSGQASSLVGQFTLQMDLQVTNQTSSPIANAQIFVISVNSGFFETQQGSSRIIKGVLTEQEIISAPKAGTNADLKRLVGSGFVSNLGNALGKVRDFAKSPAGRAAKKALCGGKSRALEGAAHSGGARSGGDYQNL